MTPKEKAEELFNKYCFAIATEITDDGFFTNTKQAKKCATIAVDECLHTCIESMIYFWEEVKKEIELITLIF